MKLQLKIILYARYSFHSARVSQPPIITSLTDVPDDQGKELDMVWSLRPRGL